MTTQEGRSILTRRTRIIEGRRVTVVTVEADRLNWQSTPEIKRAWERRFSTEEDIPPRIILDLSRAKTADDFGSDYTGLVTWCVKHLRQKARELCFGVCVPHASQVETFTICRLHTLMAVHHSLPELLEEVAGRRKERIVEQAAAAACPRCHQRIVCPHCSKKRPRRRST